ncbi:MAG: PAS domain S-box protein, partial [Planctomycetota bacterium]
MHVASDRTRRQLLEEIRVLRSRNAKLERINLEMPGHRDVQPTPDQQAQEELKNSNERFRTVLDSLDALVYVSDMDTHEILFANKYGRDIWGDIIGKTCWKTLQSGRTDPCEFCTNDKLLDSNGKPTGIHRWEFQNTVDNQWYDCHDQAIPWTDGRLVRMEIATNITERRQVEGELKKSEERYRRIVEDQTEFIVRWKPEGVRTFVNDSYCRYFGKTREELIGSSFFPLITGEDRGKVRKRIEALSPDNPVSTDEHKVIRPDGSIGWNQWTDRAIFDESGQLIEFQSTGRDITERKKAEEQLAIFRKFTEASGQGLGMADLEGRIVYCNEALCRVFLGEETPEDVLGKEVSLYYEPQSRKKIENEILPSILEKGKWIGELPLMSINGKVTPAIQSIFLIRNDIGEPTHFANVITDITERKKVEEELRQYHHIVSSSTDMMALLDKKFVYDAANPSYLEAFNKIPEEVIGHTVSEVFGKEFFETVIKPNAERCLAGEEVNYQGWFDFPAYTPRYMDINYYPYIDGNNEVSGFVVNGRNITERKRTEELLQHSTNLLRESQEVARLGHYVFDAMTGLWESSDILDAIFGIEEDYPRSVDGWLQIVHCDHRDEMSAYFSEVVLGQGQSFDREYKIMRVSDKQVRWVHGLGRLEIDKEGKPVRMIGTIQDITERKQAENALRFTQFSVDHAADAAFWMGPDAKFFYVNKAACRSLGYSREELLTMSVHDIDPDFPAEAWPAHWSEVKERGSFTVESHHRARNGRVFPVEVSINYLEFEGNEYNCAFAKDISERKQAENALRQHDKFLGCVLESLTHPFLVIDTNDYTVDMINSAAWKGELAEGATCYEVSHNRDRPCDDVEHPCLLEHIKKTGLPMTVEHIHYDQLGNARNVEVHGYPLFDDQGNVTKIIEYCLDVTKRKQAEEALEENERQFRATFEQAAVGVAHVAPDGRFIRVNQKFCDIVGYTHTEMLDCTFQDITHPDDLDADLGYVQQMLSDEISTYTLEKRYFRKDGSIVWINLTVSLFWEDLGEPKFFISVIEDITDRKRAEEQARVHQVELLHVSRLSTIGEMASSLAHELNQPLCAILGCSELCLENAQQGIKNPEQFNENLKTIATQAELAGNIIRRTRSFVKKQDSHFEPVDINNLIRETLNFMDADIRHRGIKLSLEL